MRKSKTRPRHGLPFGLFLAVMGALLLPAAVAPRANADSTDYWDSQSQGVLINQPLASNYNPTLALNVASGGQPGGFQPLQVDANFSWTGVLNSDWNSSANWSPGGRPPGPCDADGFNHAFFNQPNRRTGVTVG